MRGRREYYFYPLARPGCFPMEDFSVSTLEAKAIELGLATRETVATQFSGHNARIFRKWGRGYRQVAHARLIETEGSSGE